MKKAFIKNSMATKRVCAVIAVLIAAVLGLILAGAHAPIVGGHAASGQFAAAEAVAAAAPSPNFSGGTGTATDPFVIRNERDLNNVRLYLGERSRPATGRQPHQRHMTDRNINMHFRMDDNVDLIGFPNWEPIGTPMNPFTGFFNGNGHAVRNLNTRATDARPDYIGLFGFIEGVSSANQAQINGLGIANGIVIGSGASVGGIVGFAYNAVISNSYNRALVGAVEGLALPEFSVHFNPNGGIIPAAEAHLQDQIIRHGQGAVAPTPYRTGHTFLHWRNTLTNRTGAAAFSSITEDLGRNTPIIADWQINAYSVTFDANGATSATGNLVQSATFGQPILNQNIPVVFRQGHDFSGWVNTSANGSTLNSIQGNTVFRAEWNAHIFDVTFNANLPQWGGGLAEGSAGLNQQVVLGGAPVLPELWAEGATFIGWDGDYDAAAPVNSNRTFTARWSVNTYTVTFRASSANDTFGAYFTHFNDGSNNAPVPLEASTFANGPVREVSVNVEHLSGATDPLGLVPRDDKAAVAETAGSRIGLSFAGWDRGFDNVTGDMVVYARWDLDPGGIVGVLTGPDSMVIRCFNAGAINGDIAGGLIGTFSSEGRAVLRDSFNVGTVSGLGPDSRVGGLIGFVELGSIFNAYSAGRIGVIDPNTGTAGDITPGANRFRHYGGLVGMWQEFIDTDGTPAIMGTITNAYYNTELVPAGVLGVGTWDGAGGRRNSVELFGRTTAQMHIEDGTQGSTYNGFGIFNPWDPAGPGGTFGQTEWFAVNGSTPRLQGVEGHAHFNHTIIFDGNGGTPAVDSHPTVMFVDHGGFINPIVDNLPSFTRQGAVWRGWSQNPAATAHDPRALEYINESRIIYAVWQFNNAMVTFDGNGGDFVSGTLTREAVFGEHISGDTVPVFRRQGYFLAGWHKIMPGGGEPVFFPAWCNEASFIIGQTTFRAVWRANPVVEFRANGGRIVSGYAMQSVEFRGNAAAPTVQRPGYIFVGWDLPTENITSDTVLVAQWRFNFGNGGGSIDDPNHGGDSFNVAFYYIFGGHDIFFLSTSPMTWTLIIGAFVGLLTMTLMFAKAIENRRKKEAFAAAYAGGDYSGAALPADEKKRLKSERNERKMLAAQASTAPALGMSAPDPYGVTVPMPYGANSAPKQKKLKVKPAKYASAQIVEPIADVEEQGVRHSGYNAKKKYQWKSTKSPNASLRGPTASARRPATGKTSVEVGKYGKYSAGGASKPAPQAKPKSGYTPGSYSKSKPDIGGMADGYTSKYGNKYNSYRKDKK